MRFLIANDDGIYSPGLAILATVAKDFGDVQVVAPDVEQSSASSSISANRPLTFRPTQVIDGVEAYRVNGTPADCVALGLFHRRDVDVVLSGVNSARTLATAFGIREPSPPRGRRRCSACVASPSRRLPCRKTPS